MTAARIFLTLATILIYLITAVVMASHGVNWFAVVLGDLQALDWRTQFDVDLLTYLAIIGSWIAWREGFGVKGWVLASSAWSWAGSSPSPTCSTAPSPAAGTRSACCSACTPSPEH